MMRQKHRNFQIRSLKRQYLKVDWDRALAYVVILK